MKVYREGIGIVELPMTSRVKHKVALMKEDYIVVPFLDTVDYCFKCGDYIVHDGQKYALIEDYIPTMKDEITFSYELKFNAPWYNLDTYQFLFNTYIDGDIVRRESDWSITDTAAGILRLICDSTNDKGRDCPCVIDDFECEPTVVKSFTFSSTSILGALNNIASEFELEWWVTNEGGVNIVHLGECDSSIVKVDGSVVFNEDGSRKKDQSTCAELKVGRDIGNMNVKHNGRMPRYFYVYGSSRNIDQTWTETNIMQLPTRRLALDNPIDKGEGSGDEVVIFDDVYPKSDYKITSVDSFEYTSEDVAYYDNDNNPVYKRYTIYQVRINEFSDYVRGLIDRGEINIFNDVIASGKQLMAKFIPHDDGTQTITPQLSGFEFEIAVRDVTYLRDVHENPRADGTQRQSWFEFQIIKQDINGYSIPNTNIKPNAGDYVCIFNIKNKYIDGSEETSAIAELQKQFDKYYSNKKKEVTYSFKPYADTGIELNLGDAVKLMYADKVVYNRVNAYEKSLDIIIDSTYDLSFYTTKGTVNTLKDEVKSLTLTMGSMNTQPSSNSGTGVRDGMWNLVTNEDGTKYIHGKYDVVIDGDITAFHAEEDGYRGSNIMDGVVVDNTTIEQNASGQLSVKKQGLPSAEVSAITKDDINSVVVQVDKEYFEIDKA